MQIPTMNLCKRNLQTIWHLDGLVFTNHKTDNAVRLYCIYMPRYRNYMNDEPFRHSLFISPFKNFIHVKQFIIQIKNITTTINGTLTFVKTNKIQLVEKAC